MARTWKLAVLVAVGMGFASPVRATTISLTVNGLGLDVGQVCTAGCITQPWTNNALFAATGTVTMDDSLLLMSISLTVPYSDISGSAINGITSVQFTNTTYTFSNIPITITPGSPTVYAISGSGLATVDPATLTQVGTGGGSTNPIFSSVRVTGSCGLAADHTGQCGFTFGPTGFQVGAPLSSYVRQTFNLAMVPEPTTAALVGLGILGLGWAGRRRG